MSNLIKNIKYVFINTQGIGRYLLFLITLPIAAIFYLLSRLRKFGYKIGLLTTYYFDVPVIVVGNITVGGTGKTPIVIALAKHFTQQGKKVGVVSRGYAGAHQKGSLLVNKNTPVALCGDEPLLIAYECEVPVMVNKNRACAVQDLLMQSRVDLVISDDGLQHYAMGRAVEIVVVDGKRRFGNGLLLPAGLLREPQSRLKSVDFVINNGELCADEFSSTMQAKAFINLKTNAQKSTDFFEGQSCYGVAGIGNPQRFFDALNTLGVQVEPHIFADHHSFTPDDLHFDGAYPIIMSAKDCVKCRQFATEQMWYLQSEAELSDDFLTKLDMKL